MKRLMLLLSCLLAMTACSKNEREESPARKLSVNQTTLSYAADDAAPRQLTVTAENTDWTYEVSEAWVKADRESNTLTVSVVENTSSASRKATVIIAATENGVASVIVNVMQSGADAIQSGDEPKLEVSVNLLEFESVDAPAQNITVTVGGGVIWKARADNEWVLLSQSDNTLTVRVEDNDISKLRTSNITVYNDNDAVDVEGVRIQVVQEAAYVDPSISVTGLPENNLIVYTHYDNGTFSNNLGDSWPVVSVEPKTASWSVEVTEGNDWYNVTFDKSTGVLNCYIKDSGTKNVDEATAQFIIKHEDPSVEPIVVNVRKSALTNVDLSSTLSESVKDLKTTKSYGRITTYGGLTATGNSRIQMAFYTDDVEYYYDTEVQGNVGYNYSGKGEIVLITLYDDDKVNDITQRTFTVANDTKPGTAVPGGVSVLTRRLKLRDCSYARIDNNVEKDEAFAVVSSGTVTVSKSGDEYLIEWDFISDNGYVISGHYEGKIDFQLYDQSIGGDGGMGFDDDPDFKN